jgi:hypothetical protein
MPMIQEDRDAAPGSRCCSTLSTLVVPVPSSKRDCNFVKKSALFESLLRISRTTKKKQAIE